MTDYDLRRAVEDALASLFLTLEDFQSATSAVHALIQRNVEIALDPAVSAAAKAIAEKAAAEEREACANVCEAQFSGVRAVFHPTETSTAQDCAAAIRKRGEPTDAELERLTGEPHIDGWPLYSGLPPPAKAKS